MVSSEAPPSRTLPNIIITGTPGVGKSVHSQQLARDTTEGSSGPGLKVMSINDIVKEKECHEGWDAERGCWIVDEDKLLDAMEEKGVKENGGWIIDWHACDLFPKSWIDLVVVLRCAKTEVLWDRLKARYVIALSSTNWRPFIASLRPYSSCPHLLFVHG